MIDRSLSSRIPTLSARSHSRPTILDCRSFDTELPPSCLWTVFDDFLSSDPSKFLRALSFFHSYSFHFSLPLSLCERLQSFLFTLLTPELPDALAVPCLAIIENISGSFSARSDFRSLISRIWHFLPNSAAFDCLSALVRANEEAAVVLLSPEYSQSLCLLFGDSETVSGTLSVLGALACHSVCAVRARPMFEALVSYHRTARGSARTQTLEGLEGLVGEPEWRRVLAEDENLCEILAVEDGEKAQLLAALRFLRALLDGAVEPGEVFKRARGISLVIVGAAQESELIRSAALSVCAVVAGDCIDELVESDLPASFLAWRECSTFKLWRETISVLCQLFLLAPPNLAVHFLELGFADALIDAISTSYTPDHLLHALIALISIWRNTGHSENIEALTDNSALLSAITQTPTAAPILDILFPGD